MENKFIIVTDITCDIPETLSDKDFYEIPMEYIMDDGKVYTCGKEDSISNAEFYKLLRDGHQAKTSQISPKAGMDFLRPFVEKGYDVLNISFSSALSATADNMELACKNLSEEFPDRKLYSLDSKITTNGLGMLCAEAIRLRKEGKTIEEVRDRIKYLIPKQNIYFTVDDLMHLYRGGRLPKATALAGTVMRIKPILYITPTGALRNIEKVMSKKLCYRRMAEIVKHQSNELTTWFSVAHADNREEAEKLAQKVSEVTGITKYYITELSPIIGSHSGAGTLTVNFFGKDNIEIKSAD